MKKIIIISLLLLAGLTATAQVFTPVAYDKKFHIGAGVVMGTWGTFMGNSLELTPEQSALTGMATAAAAGIGKELWDLSWRLTGDKNAQFDFNDVAATTLGGVVGVGLSYAALKIFKKRPPVIYGSANKGLQVGVILPIR